MGDKKAYISHVCFSWEMDSNTNSPPVYDCFFLNGGSRQGVQVLKSKVGADIPQQACCLCRVFGSGSSASVAPRVRVSGHRLFAGGTRN